MCLFQPVHYLHGAPLLVVEADVAMVVGEVVEPLLNILYQSLHYPHLCKRMLVLVVQVDRILTLLVRMEKTHSSKQL